MNNYIFNKNEFYSCLIPDRTFHRYINNDKKLHCSISRFEFDTNESNPIILFDNSFELTCKVIRYDRFGSYLVMILDKNDMIKNIKKKSDMLFSGYEAAKFFDDKEWIPHISIGEISQEEEIPKLENLIEVKFEKIEFYKNNKGKGVGGSELLYVCKLD